MSNAVVQRTAYTRANQWPEANDGGEALFRRVRVGDTIFVGHSWTLEITEHKVTRVCIKIMSVEPQVSRWQKEYNPDKNHPFFMCRRDATIWLAGVVYDRAKHLADQSEKFLNGAIKLLEDLESRNAS